MTFLSDDDREALISAAVKAKLMDRRELLLSEEVRSQIPTDKAPRVQLMLDLCWLSERHAQRPESPLAHWLRQAIQIAADYPERNLFRAVLERLPETPELAEDLLARWREFTGRSHSKPAPFVTQVHDDLLDNLFVDLDLDDRVVDPSARPAQMGRSLEALLREDQPGRWVILGEPGAGKSTLARHLAWHMSQAASNTRPPPPLPIFLSLARLAECGEHPFDLAEQQLGRRAGKDTARGLGAALRKAATRPRRLWVFFDGLDEVPPDRVRELITDIQAWAEDWTGAAIVVLSRPASFVEVGRAFRRAYVRRLDDGRQEELLRRWLTPERARGVWLHLQTHPRLHAEARNPLLLTLVALLARHDQALPASRVDVYRQSLDLLFERGHGVDSTGVTSPQMARRLARLLARRLTERGGEAWSRAHLIDRLVELDPGPLLEPWGRSAERFLDDLSRHAGVLAAHDGRDQPWRFLHRSLRELLTAEQVWSEVENSDDPEARILAITDSLSPEAVGTWGEPLAMLCGRLSDQIGFLERLAQVKPELALRAFPNLDGVAAEQAIDFLARVLGEETEQIVDNARRLGLTDAVVARALLGIITPKLPPARLAALYALICELDAPPTRAEFFGRAGRLDPPPAIDWVPIPGGRTRIGRVDRPDGDADVPAHEVDVTPFEMSATPLTVHHLRCWRADFAPGSPPELPATGLAWDEALLVCAWLGARLPTEVEWEHACRAGTSTRFWSGDSDDDLAKVGWSLGDAGDAPRPVGGKPANPWGLHDMHGNVAEWCDGRFVPGYCATYPPPAGTPDSRARVVRGGFFAEPSDRCRASARRGVDPREPRAWIGVRPVRDP